MLVLVPLAGRAASVHWRRSPLACNRRSGFAAAVRTTTKRHTTNSRAEIRYGTWRLGTGKSFVTAGTVLSSATSLCQITDLAKSVFRRNSLADSRDSRWRAQLPGGSNWDSDRPGGARGGRAAPG
jgi:hypothetical protein